MAQTNSQTHATGTYGIKSWDEKTWDGVDYTQRGDAKVTQANVVFTFSGDFEGEANIRFLMCYRDETYATFVGLQEMNGKLGGRSGSFVLKVDGVFENGAASSTWEIISGSGKDGLSGIQGVGESVAHHGDTQPFTLDYSFE